MKQSEIQAIQEKLQTIRAGGNTSGKTSPKTYDASTRLESSPGGDSATATVSRTHLGHRDNASTTHSTIPSDIPAAEVEARRSPFREAVAASGMVELTPSGVAHSRQPSPQLSSFSESQSQRYTPQWQQPLVSSTQLQPGPSSQTQRLQQALREKLDHRVEEVLQYLEVQVDRINQLSGDQEAAMLELRKLVARAERDIKAIRKEGELLPDFDPLVPTLNYLASAVPWIEQDERGMFVVISRPLDLAREERESVLTAQALRERVSRVNRTASEPFRSPVRKRRRDDSGILGELSKGVLAWVSRLGTPSSRSSYQRGNAGVTTQPLPASSPISFMDSFIWVVGAVLARVGLNMLLASFPGLWLPVMGMIIAPAAYAAYRATVSPQSGFILGYRLFLIMIGLLLGGRLV